MNSNVQNSLGVYGEVTVEHWRGGELVAMTEGHNLVTNAGLAWLAGALSGDETATDLSYVAIGTGTTNPAVGDTEMETEYDREQGTVTRETVTVTNDTLQVLAEFTFTESVAVTEFGLLDAATAGTLVAHVERAVMNVVSDDELRVRWRLTFSRVA